MQTELYIYNTSVNDRNSLRVELFMKKFSRKPVCDTSHSSHLLPSGVQSFLITVLRSINYV
jgi:hypothetical protein